MHTNSHELHMIARSRYEIRHTYTRSSRSWTKFAYMVSRLLHTIFNKILFNFATEPIAFVCGNSAIALSNSNQIEQFAHFMFTINFKMSWVFKLIINLYIEHFLQGCCLTHAFVNLQRGREGGREKNNIGNFIKFKR